MLDFLLNCGIIYSRARYIEQVYEKFRKRLTLCFATTHNEFEQFPSCLVLLYFLVEVCFYIDFLSFIKLFYLSRRLVFAHFDSLGL